MSQAHAPRPECTEAFARLDKAVFGNATPETSVLTRICMAEKGIKATREDIGDIKKTARRIWFCVVALLGNLIVTVAKVAATHLFTMNGGP